MFEWKKPQKAAVLDVFLSGAQYPVQAIPAGELLCGSSRSTMRFNVVAGESRTNAFMCPRSECFAFSHQSGLAEDEQLNNIF